MGYLNKNKKYIFLLCLIAVAYNLYYIFLIPDGRKSFLIYLDVLLLIGTGVFFGFDCHKYRVLQREKEDLLKTESLVTEELGSFENSDIAIHDTQILFSQLGELSNVNRDLQDYITKWCHEIKLPLAAGLIMTEKITDDALRSSMREQLEKMNRQLNSALLGCKVQSKLLDINMRQVSLMDCVRTSIRNNQFFLMKNRFELDVNVDNSVVYSDQSWLVYIIDQMLSNSVKYAGEEPMIRIWSEQAGIDKAVESLEIQETSETLTQSAASGHEDDVSELTSHLPYIRLCIEDNGEGIKDSDIRRIFEKGFTGSNHHNGQYRSTGMGLYMAATIAEKLGHRILAESEYGIRTRFTIEFRDNRDFFPR